MNKKYNFKYSFISKIVSGFVDGCNIIRVYTDDIVMEGTNSISYPDMTRVGKHDVSLIRRCRAGKIRKLAGIPWETEIVFYDNCSPEDPCDPPDDSIVSKVKISRANIMRALEILASSYARKM